MIKPHKYMNLDLSLINFSARIIELLKSNHAMTLSTLKKRVENDFNINYFIYAIDFLYLFDKVTYDSKTDIVRLKYEANENILK